MKKIILTIVSFILIGIFIYLGWVMVTFILKIFFNSLKNLNQNQTTLLIALVPSSISIVGIIFSNNLQKQKELDFKNREKKEKAYDNFIKVFYEFLIQSKSGKTDKQLTNLIARARKDLVLWGSDEIVKLYSEFMTIAQTKPESDESSSLLNTKLEQILLAIRKDLGYKNSKLNFGDLIRFLK